MRTRIGTLFRRASLFGWLALALASPGTASADPPIQEDIRELTERLLASPHDVDLLVQRADQYLRQRQYRSALQDLRVAAALAPHDARVAVSRARVYLATSREAAALASLSDVVPAQDALGAEIFALRAQAYEELGRLPEAIEALDEAIARRTNVDDHIVRARYLVRARRVDEAMARYDEGLEALNGAASLRHEAVTVALRVGQYERALAWCTPVIESSTGPARWLLLRARAADQLGRRADALADRQAALRDLDTRLAERPSVALQVERGEALLALRRTREARQVARTAIARDPRYAPARRLLRAVDAAQSAESASREARAGGAR